MTTTAKPLRGRLYIDGGELQRALGKVFGLDPEKRGNKKRIAAELSRRLRKAKLLDRGGTIAQARYSNVITGREGSLETVEEWCRVAGIEIRIKGGRLSFVLPPTAPPDPGSDSPGDRAPG